MLYIPMIINEIYIAVMRCLAVLLGSVIEHYGLG